MTDAHKQGVSGQPFLTVELYRLDPALCICFNACNLGFKPHLAAQTDDFQADILHHLSQHIRANMRLVKVFYFRRCSCCHKILQHLAHKRVIYPGGKLAIRKGACSSLAKLYIGLFVKFPCMPEMVNICVTAIHIPAPLHHNRVPTMASQAQCRKHASRPKASHHRRQLPSCRLMHRQLFLLMYWCQLDILILFPAT